MMWGGFGGYGMPWGFGFGWLGLLFMLLFWGTLIFLAVRLIGGLFPSTAAPGRGKSQTARAILDERYVRGEITQDEYHRILKDIQQ